MKITRVLLFLLMIAALAWPSLIARADDPGCTFNSDGSITCKDGGGGGGGGGGSNPTPPPVACTPGASVWVTRYVPDGFGTCSIYLTRVDQCTGQFLEMSPNIQHWGTCPTAPAQPNHPCTTFSVNSGGITCDADDKWHVKATVRFPETFLDVRPFPATLVRWPTAVRNGGQPSASGSGTQGYYGSGSPASPNVGDWSDIRLTLTLNPASPLFVTLPNVGALSLSDQGSSGSPQTIQWELPSHPEAGGGPLAGSVDGMDEIPGDIPLFVGNGRSGYRLFWNLSYNQYEAIRECVSGPNGAGKYNCGGGTGHMAVVGYEWRRHSSGGEIPPSAVANLPGSVAADINGDGMPEAYWNHNLTLRRMDDSGSVDNPTYRRSWNWGGLIYWAVREGQGQIGWPDGQ
jgi:hypothetical protein